MTKLEKRIQQFDEKVSLLQRGLMELKTRQDELIDLIKRIYGNKKT